MATPARIAFDGMIQKKLFDEKAKQPSDRTFAIAREAVKTLYPHNYQSQPGVWNYTIEEWRVTAHYDSRLAQSILGVDYMLWDGTNNVWILNEDFFDVQVLWSLPASLGAKFLWIIGPKNAVNLAKGYLEEYGFSLVKYRTTYSYDLVPERDAQPVPR